MLFSQLRGPAHCVHIHRQAVELGPIALELALMPLQGGAINLLEAVLPG